LLALPELKDILTYHVLPGLYATGEHERLEHQVWRLYTPQ